MNAEWTLETGGAFATALFKRVLTPEPVHALTCGDRVGPYRLEEKIGRGGSAAIFRGTRCDGAFQQEVAIKVLNRAQDDEQAGDWEERNLLAKLVHPAIAQIHDGGTTPDGVSWFAMELVSGSSLRQHFERRARHWKDRMQIVLQVVDAVQFAHSRGVIHGDIKPANVLVDAQGNVKLVDFGIANAMEAEDSAAIRAVFTPGYASPEQLVGAELTTRSDIFQLGLLIEKHVLSPMRAIENDTATIDQYKGDAGEIIGAEIRARLTRICARATNEAPSQRYGSVFQLGAELAALMADAASAAASPVGELAPTPDAAAAASRPARATKRVVVIAIVVLLLLGGGNVWLLRDRQFGFDGEPAVAALKSSTQLEHRELDRLALELRTRFDGDWMKRVVAVEGLAKSYWQMESFQEAYRLAEWAFGQSLEDPSAQARDRLRLQLLKLGMAPVDTAPTALYQALDTAAALLDESRLGEFSIERVELLTLTLQIENRYGSDARIEEVATTLGRVLASAKQLPELTRAKAEDAIGMLRLYQSTRHETVLAELQASSEIRSASQAQWDIDRLKIAMLRVILSGEENQRAMFVEFMRGLRDIEAQHGNSSDSYAIAKFYFAIVLFETGRQETLQRAAEIFDEVSEKLAGRGSDFLGHLVLAESYRALAALKLGEFDAASMAAARASTFSASVVGPAHPLRRIVDAVSVAAECGRNERPEAIRGSRLRAEGRTQDAARVELADIVQFAVLSDCLGAERALATIGITQEALDAALESNVLSPRLRSEAQSGRGLPAARL